MVHGAASAALRPRLRGWSHAVMAPLAVVGTAVLWQAAGDNVGKRVSVAVFGIALTGLYTTSSLYHLGRWSARARYVLSRCDVAMIQLFIAASFTPVALHALDGAYRTVSLVVAWAIAAVGAGIAASPLQVPRWVATLGFTAVGWLTVVPFTRIAQALPAEGTALIVFGGLLYTAGAVVYARQRPDPLPAWFGFHEVFHLLVVAASVCHYLAIWRYVLPIR